jgi:hypothetical protein
MSLLLVELLTVHAGNIGVRDTSGT